MLQLKIQKKFFKATYLTAKIAAIISFKKEKILKQYKNQLLQRADHIETALSGIGTRMTMLKTQELIELIYNAYNPNLFIDTQIGDINNIELN